LRVVLDSESDAAAPSMRHLVTSYPLFDLIAELDGELAAIGIEQGADETAVDES